MQTIPVGDAVPAIIKKARWLWVESPNYDLVNNYMLFRKKEQIRKVPAQFVLYVTADQAYQLYINGQYVCRGPARGYQSHWPYDEVDVAAYLREGENIFAARVFNPGRGTFTYLSQSFAGFLLAARGGGIEILTDDSWKAKRQHGVRVGTIPSSLQLFDQEHIDLRIEPSDWMESSRDDSGWSKVSTRVWNAPPWNTLEPRGIPMLEERKVSPVKILGMDEGASAPEYLTSRDVFRVRFDENHEHQKAESNYAPLHVEPTGEGKYRSYLIDFGKTVVGSISFTAKGTHGGEIIDMLHVEALYKGKLKPNLHYPAHCQPAFANRATCREGESSHRFYQIYGFRYLVLVVRDSEVPLEIDLWLNWVGYPLEHKGSFQSSIPELNRIWETCAWTQQCCSLDAYVDTPWREQGQWWGDARVQAWNTFHINGDARLFRRGIHCIAGQTTATGLTYGLAPTIAHGCVLPDFTLIWILTLWDYYWQTGSTEAFTAHKDVLLRALDYFEAQTDKKKGLVAYDNRYWTFLDWTNLFKEGYSTLLNLWLLLALEKISLLATATKDAKLAAKCKSWAKRLRLSLAKLVDKGGLVHDGITLEGKTVAETSIHTQVLALQADLKGISGKNILHKIFLPFIRGEDTPKASPSAYWITYLFSELGKQKCGTEIIPFIIKKWMPMVEHGTTWETFESTVPGEGSHSHAWSAHPLFHFMQIIGGIRQEAPAWQTISYSPDFIGDFAETNIPTPHGLIRSAWKKKKERIEIRLILPHGVKAFIDILGLPKQTVSGSHTWKIEKTTSPI